jgi:uncharacterized protein (TIGR03382 family)
MLLLLLAAVAYPFCGTFVGTAGTELFSSASEVAVVREGTRTTLTMANDYQGPVSEFAVVVPVPEVLGEEDVRVVDPFVFDRLQAYSGPRLVSYTCEELYPDPPPRGSASDAAFGGLGCISTVWYSEYELDMGDSGYGGTVIEAQFIVGEYEVVVLSAEESSGMLQWLNDNGYAVSPTASELIQEYLDADSYFFAAKVFPELVPPGQNKLSPLQFAYESPAFSLPIRLGTANSPGVQDLVVYAVSPLSAGRIGIANYERRQVESVCLVPEGEDFGTFYEGEYARAIEGDAAHWVAEYGWEVKNNAVKCDPCPEGVNPGQPIPAGDVVTLGFGRGESGNNWDTGWSWTLPEFYFTRLHMRFTPEQARQDLVLYASGITENTQLRYVVHEPYLEAAFPVCGAGWIANPGSCADVDPKYRRRMRAAAREADGGCNATGAAGTGAWALIMLMAVLTSRTRRRE